MEQAWLDTFTTRTYVLDYESRKQAFFKQVMRNLAPVHGSQKKTIIEVVRLAAGGRPDENVMHESLTNFIEGRED